MNKITATITNPQDNGHNYTPDKELISAYSVVVLHKGELKTVLTARSYMSRHGDGASPVYASIWCHSGARSCAGHARASGYGYHKESGAFGAAISNAGIELSEGIGGRGDQAMRDAFVAIARALGYRGKLLVVSH